MFIKMKVLRLIIPILVIFLIFGVACTSIDNRVLDQKKKETVAEKEIVENSTKESAANRRIVFVSDRDGNNEIYIMNIEGSKLSNLTESSGNDIYPSFSQDEQKIIFSSDCDGNSEIYMMNADGSEQVNLTNNPASDGTPSFSP